MNCIKSMFHEKVVLPMKKRSEMIRFIESYLKITQLKTKLNLSSQR